MRVYLDDNSAGRELAAILRKSGHEVVVPSNVDNSGISDPKHLKYALQHGLILVTQDHKDFTDLHELIWQHVADIQESLWSILPMMPREISRQGE